MSAAAAGPLRAGPGRGDGSVSSLPPASTGALTQDYLAEVDRALHDAIARLVHTWRVELASPLGPGSPPAPPADILLDHDLPEMLQALNGTGGKRIRPSMAYWGWVACGGPGAEGAGTTDDGGAAHVVRAGAALELLHIFALIHDDVMDESDSRRGQPSVHTLAAQLHLHAGARGDARHFGESIAVLVGDLAHAEADHLVTELPRPMREIWRLLVIELVHGQSRDLTGSAAGRRDLDHARRVARMKSGRYTVQRPLELGAAAAGASAEVRDALLDYGEEVGEAFALRDDLLGVWGDPRSTGKPAGDDLLSGKPTVIMALADERLHGSARRVLRRVGTPELSPADVTLLQSALAEQGVVEAVEARISAHVRSAGEALARVDLAEDGVAGLTGMAHLIAWRDR
ncbi:polyprenyl synthetase family protein [Microlunatus flavus]|uniref:Geranylgeranyl diphosphate synthase, type I n=1 Tax=Microlunatus flavus TaxID=1036181 RepID=A0A1H8ZE78_9ACTN|nr:polyprenyl synthetase family protein [Microlunatus flavus]SEP62028.1 geranylgeranyl diphosphate synthase, type I [Microlunatus flavus]